MPAQCSNQLRCSQMWAGQFDNRCDCPASLRVISSINLSLTWNFSSAGRLMYSDLNEGPLTFFHDAWMSILLFTDLRICFFVHGNSAFDFSWSVKYAFTYTWFRNQRFVRDWLFQFLEILASFKGKLGAKGVRPATSLATWVRIEDWELTFTRQLLNQEGLKLVWHTRHLHLLCTVTCHIIFESQW